MSEKPYTEYMQDHKNMILRDYLAIDRTILANETSFMSYVRTSLTLIAAGATLIKFFNNNELMQILGWAFIGVGGWFAFYGYRRYRQVDKLMHQVKGDYINEHLKKTKKHSEAWKWTMNLLRRSID